MSKKKEQVAAEDSSKAITKADDEPISKVSINKYDPYQLKSSIDDEIVFVSALTINDWFSFLRRRALQKTTNTLISRS